MSSAVLFRLTPPSNETALAFGYTVQLPGVRSFTAWVAAGAAEVAGAAAVVVLSVVGLSVGPHAASSTDVTQAAATAASGRTLMGVSPHRLVGMVRWRLAGSVRRGSERVRPPAGRRRPVP